MTTPRDAIGLSERLRNAAEDSKRFGAAAWVFEPMLEAATALDALQARVKELERIERNRDMWKGQCERQAEQLTKLRQQRDEAYELAAKVATVQAKQGATAEQIGYAIRRLAAGTEKKGK